jgi:hypothetical protein
MNSSNNLIENVDPVFEIDRPHNTGKLYQYLINIFLGRFGNKIQGIGLK